MGPSLGQIFEGVPVAVHGIPVGARHRLEVRVIRRQAHPVGRDNPEELIPFPTLSWSINSFESTIPREFPIFRTFVLVFETFTAEPSNQAL